MKHFMRFYTQIRYSLPWLFHMWKPAFSLPPRRYEGGDPCILSLRPTIRWGAHGIASRAGGRAHDPLPPRPSRRCARRGTAGCTSRGPRGRRHGDSRGRIHADPGGVRAAEGIRRVAAACALSPAGGGAAEVDLGSEAERRSGNRALHAVRPPSSPTSIWWSDIGTAWQGGVRFPVTPSTRRPARVRKRRAGCLPRPARRNSRRTRAQGIRRSRKRLASRGETRFRGGSAGVQGSVRRRGRCKKLQRNNHTW